MASVQQSMNQLFNTFLAAGATGAHAWRQSPQGQVAAKRRGIKEINTTIENLTKKQNLTKDETELLEQLSGQAIGAQRDIVRTLPTVANSEELLAGLNAQEGIRRRIDKEKERLQGEAAAEAEKEARLQQAEEFYEGMSPEQQKEAAAQGQESERIVEDFLKAAADRKAISSLQSATQGRLDRQTGMKERRDMVSGGKK